MLEVLDIRVPLENYISKDFSKTLNLKHERV